MYIGIDNGVTGTIGFVTQRGVGHWMLTPTLQTFSFTKKIKRLRRIDGIAMSDALKEASLIEPIDFVIMEQPFINQKFFHVSLSAIRAFEATLIVIELLKVPYRVIPAKEWQKALFPKGYEDKDTKNLALAYCKRCLPTVEFKKADLADGLCIALYARIMTGASCRDLVDRTTIERS